MWEELGTANDEIEVVTHRDKWVAAFESESKRIMLHCSGILTAIEHIGSTSVPGLAAKSVLDIMLGLATGTDGEKLVKPMTDLGYEFLGEYGIEGRYFFVLKHQNRTVVHAHGFAITNDNWHRHLFFRDYLINHPDARKEYERIKLKLAEQYRKDRKAYSDGKSDFIRSIENLRYSQ